METQDQWDDKILKLSPLELNNIRLDNKHTILTPDYLEKIIQGKSGV